MLADRLDRWLRGHPTVVDGVLAFLLAVPNVLGWLVGDNWAEAALSLALIAPLAWRRRFPVAVTAAVAVAALVTWASVDILFPAAIAVPVAVHAATAYGPRWAGRAALAAGIAGAGLQAAKSSDPSAVVTWFFVAALSAVVVAAWALGSLARTRRERLSALQERARLLESERDQQARLAVAAERARIAREMHDVVAHSLAVVVAQADGGRYAAAADPAAAERALGTIGETARGALGEMRRLLAVLRDDGERGEPRAPQPGLDALPALVERIRSGGVPVALTVDGEPRQIPEGIGLAAFRIAQEGLTNVLKHAGPGASAEVRVRWSGRAVEVQVLDDGLGPAGAGTSGHGLLGMRERAGVVGGTVETGPRPGGGFAVRAMLPL